jgi:hypothetical protein
VARLLAVGRLDSERDGLDFMDSCQVFRSPESSTYKGK